MNDFLKRRKKRNNLDNIFFNNYIYRYIKKKIFQCKHDKMSFTYHYKSIIHLSNIPMMNIHISRHFYLEYRKYFDMRDLH